jgi:site-specific recombinase XerD
MNTLVTVQQTSIEPHYSANDFQVSEDALAQIRNSKAKNSRVNYQCDFNHFSSWCIEQNRTALPATPETIATYIAHCVESLHNKPSTISRRLSGIRFAHLTNQFASPTEHPKIREQMEGINRTLGTKQNKRAALTLDLIFLMLSKMDNSTLQGKRDKALILFGLGSACRRSELSALNVEDLSFTEEGLTVHIQSSKTDKTGQGAYIGIPNGRLKISDVVRDYLQAAGVSTGGLFRTINKGGKVGSRMSDKSIYNLVKKYAALAGLDAAQFGAHSLRSGFITEAYLSGASTEAIQATTRQVKSDTTIGYYRPLSVYKNNAGKNFL